MVKLVPGTHIALVTRDETNSLLGRFEGWELRDTLLVLAPTVLYIFLFRVPLEEPTIAQQMMKTGSGGLHVDACKTAAGRWPTNLLLLSDAIKTLDGQSGFLKSGTGSVKRESAKGYVPNAFGKESRPVGTAVVGYGDEGGASRFFPQFSNMSEVLDWVATLIGDFRWQ